MIFIIIIIITIIVIITSSGSGGGSSSSISILLLATFFQNLDIFWFLSRRLRDWNNSRGYIKLKHNVFHVISLHINWSWATFLSHVSEFPQETKDN